MKFEQFLDIISSTSIIYIGFWIFSIILIIYCLYWLFFIPVNWTRDLTDVGYNHITSKISRKDLKIEAINRIRRLRNINDNNNIPPPFPNGWYALIESENLKICQAIQISCLGENFVVFRTDKNVVHVLDAYCPHLGANLGVGGLVRDDCIECPFHQWAFRGSDGQCVNIPYSTSGAVAKTAKLKKWTSLELNGTIFVWYHIENEEPWCLPVVQEIVLNEWIYHGRNEFTINCHIQEIPENGADIAHLNAVHGPSMLAGTDLRFSRASWASFGTHAWEAKWQACTDPELKHTAIIALKHSLRIFNKFELCRMDVCAKQIGPSYVQLFMNSSFGPFVILQTVTPIEPLIQKVIHRFYGPKNLAIFMKFLISGESIMFERDIMIWNNKTFSSSPCLVKEDRSIKLYRNWYSQFYSENSKTFAQSKESLEW